MREWALRGAGLLAALAGLSVSAAHLRSISAASGGRFAIEPSVPRDSRWESVVPETRIVSSGSVPSVHAAAAVEIEGGRIRAVWYGGSREGARDVAIYSAVFDAEKERWSEEEIVTTREETESDLGRYVKKLGNPVISRDPRGRLWLFYVSVSVGGWSGSSINFRMSEDEGRSWSAARKLVTSPFLNVSTLVKGPAFAYEDGTLGLPVYHEFLGKFGELLRLSPDGVLLEKTRLSWGRSSLQPVVVPLGPGEAVAFLRRSGSSPPRILSSETSDGGESWSALEPVPLPNPDAAVAAIRRRDGSLLLAFNDSEVDRSSLNLASSRDGGESFEIVRAIDSPEPAEEPPELAYPWLLEDSRGDVHVLYSWNRRRIVHVRFRDGR